MAFFKRKKAENNTKKETNVAEDTLKEDISKAYDEIMAKGTAEEKNEQPQPQAESTSNFESELLKSNIKTFKEEKTQEALFNVIKLLPNRQFFVPSVSNMKEPFEKVDGEIKLKQGAVLNPALLTGSDKKIFLPIFTDEQAMVQKSPSGVILKFAFEQCVGIVNNEKNPVEAIVINPFTENMVFGKDLLDAAFKKQKKEEN